MKKHIVIPALFLFLALFVSSSLHSQSPLGIPYQAVMRNADGSVMASSTVNITFMIHDGTANGTVVDLYPCSYSATCGDAARTINELFFFDAATGEPYAGSPQTHTIVHGGVKVGFVGLVEEDWIATLGAVDPATIQYRDMFEAGTRLATQLRAEGCALVVALTHSRLPNDELMAERCPEFDLVCGGHDARLQD